MASTNQIIFQTPSRLSILLKHTSEFAITTFFPILAFLSIMHSLQNRIARALRVDQKQKTISSSVFKRQERFGISLFSLDFCVFSYPNWHSSFSNHRCHFSFGFVKVSTKHHCILRLFCHPRKSVYMGTCQNDISTEQNRNCNAIM